MKGKPQPVDGKPVSKRRGRSSRRGSGELIPYKGTWYARWYDETGKRRQRSTGTKHKPDAQGFLAERIAEVRRIRSGRARSDRTANVLIGELLPKWTEGLTNRNAVIDRARVARYLVPKWGHVKLSAVDVAALLEWIDELRTKPVPPPGAKHGRAPASGRIAEPTIRGILNLLSRFFAWSVERKHATHNPVRDIPRQRRPIAATRKSTAWLDDDVVVRQLVNTLRHPIGTMFYLGNRSGLRTGELAGLRLSDLAELQHGAIRVRYSYDGPLKEDKTGEGKMKWVPAPADAEAVLGPWLEQRRAAGAGPEDLAFVNDAGGMFDKTTIGRAWDAATARKVKPSDSAKGRRRKRKTTGPLVTLTWYQATRHSFTTRNLRSGVPLDEVSAAVGHSTPNVTKRYYDHFIRKSFSPGLREGLGLTGPIGPDAPVLPLHDARKGENRQKDGTKGERKRAK